MPVVILYLWSLERLKGLPQVDGVPLKNSQMVDFEEQLDLGPFMAPRALDTGPALYRLFGIIVHEGTRNSPHSGHYVAYVRGANGQWWECNDAQVRSCRLHGALNITVVFRAPCPL